MNQISGIAPHRAAETSRTDIAVVRLGIYGDVNLTDVDDVTADAGTPVNRTPAVRFEGKA